MRTRLLLAAAACADAGPRAARSSVRDAITGGAPAGDTLRGRCAANARSAANARARTCGFLWLCSLLACSYILTASPYAWRASHTLPALTNASGSFTKPPALLLARSTSSNTAWRRGQGREERQAWQERQARRELAAALPSGTGRAGTGRQTEWCGAAASRVASRVATCHATGVRLQ